VRTPIGNFQLKFALPLLAIATILPWPCDVAYAVPAFAVQTGQPCEACHIGAFGPQLTPFGRAFKIGGYTQGGGQGPEIPLALTAIGSFTHTDSAQPTPPADHFRDNDNFSLDQVSAYFAGRITSWAGAFVQGTYDGIAHAFRLDNTDIRPLTTVLEPGNRDLRVGISVNNNPTVQDPYNSTYAWGYPFVASALAPTPAAQPAVATALSGNSIGLTAYAWYDESLYVEAGGYETQGPTFLHLTGATLNGAPFGSTAGIAPYFRAAYEWNWKHQSAHLGGLIFHSDFNPATAAFTVSSALGRNDYTDVAVDAGYQFLGDNTNIFTAEGIYTHESQNLEGAFNAGQSSQTGNELQQIRLALTYYYRETYGVTFGWQHTWGNANPLLNAPAPVSGSANGRPNSNAFMVEADWVPFGKSDSVARPWVNLKIGIQATAYTSFNGGATDFDGFGRSARANDTIFLFSWLAF
jgi:hypothetical protein